MNEIANKAAYYARIAQYASDGFSQVYLGAKDTAPTTDNNGNPLIVGALYFNSTNDTMYVWDGTAWDVATNFNENTPFLSTGSATARTLANRFADVVNVKDFGAVGDGVADDTAAIQAAITFGATNNKAVYLPSGDFICSNKITTLNGSIVVFGDGINATKVIFTSTNGGFDFNLISQGVNTPPEQIVFSDLTLESNAAVSSPALSATWSTYQPNAQGQAWINNLNIIRKNNGTGSFVNAIKLNKCIAGVISNTFIVGDDARVSDIGINLIDCIGVRIDNVDINRYKTGINVTKISAVQTEGIYITNSFVYDIFKGLYVNKAIHIQVSNTHFNINGASATYSIEFIDVEQSSIQNGCLVYLGGNSGDPINQRGISILRGGTITIAGNQVVDVNPSNSEYGIFLTESSYNTIANNANNAPIGLFISNSTCIKNNIIGNTFFSNITAFSDNGTSTFRSANNKDGIPLDGLSFSSNAGNFNSGTISANSFWGGFIRGHSGSVADVALVSSGNKPILCIRDANNAAYPGNDNLYSLGTSANRWSVVYAATGTINTSDEREKTFLSIEDSEKLAALEIKQNLRKFKFNSSIEEKGENARIHFGASAQQVGDIMKSHGLDPNKYGFYCYDEWDEIQEVKNNDGNTIQEYRPAGNRYGIRYEELLAFIISAI